MNDPRYWLFAVADPDTNRLLHVRLFPTRTQALTEMFLTEPCEKHLVDDAIFVVDRAPRLQAAAITIHTDSNTSVTGIETPLNARLRC